MSLDRILPEKFSSISKHGTPWVSILAMLVGAEIMLVIFTMYATVLSTITIAFGTFGVFFIACIAAIVLPFRKQTKRIFETAPKLASMKIAGFPVMSLAGILGTLVLGWVFCMYVVNPAYGASNPTSLVSVAGIFVACLLGYYVAKWYRARQGLDVSLAFTEVPPL
jgi:amino acid permease